MQILTTFEDLILLKLAGYSRPVKTKHLAERLKIERVDLIGSLNRLRKAGKIDYIKELNPKGDHRGREENYYGWVICLDTQIKG